MPNKGFKHSEKSKRLISLHASSRRPEVKLKMSKALKGKFAYNKGKRENPIFTEKRRIALTGRKRSVAERLAIAKGMKGSKSHFWKGGINEIKNTIRNSVEYKLWRESVFKRDNYTCIWCGQIGGALNADHIKPFAYFPELRFAIDNGRTLCVGCHRRTDTWGKNDYTKK